MALTNSTIAPVFSSVISGGITGRETTMFLSFTVLVSDVSDSCTGAFVSLGRSASLFFLLLESTSRAQPDNKRNIKNNTCNKESILI